MSESRDAINAAAAANRPEVSPLRLNPRMDPGILAPVFARHGRIHVPAIFDRATALAVHQALTAEPVPWQLHFNDGAQAYDVPAAEFDALAPAERERLLRPIHARARTGFQYLFENFSIADHHARGEHLGLELMRVFEFLRSDCMLEFVRRVTGSRDIATVDAQATRYRAGHFLTVHDDRDEQKGRVTAYVLSMTPKWRADWGGVLQFLDEDGHVAEGYVPAFNALNLFRVPAPHSVSLVAPYVEASRFSITGWLRRF
ncbi:MAG TPA: 2OG-Fe(II) oxygenase family protein [Steroidobacteraceae bacterium]|nr:2OG-Fe(II) oxygenase family protein [Steroidobacteraceae bacterium]